MKNFTKLPFTTFNFLPYFIQLNVLFSSNLKKSSSPYRGHNTGAMAFLKKVPNPIFFVKLTRPKLPATKWQSLSLHVPKFFGEKACFLQFRTSLGGFSKVLNTMAHSVFLNSNNFRPKVGQKIFIEFFQEPVASSHLILTNISGVNFMGKKLLTHLTTLWSNFPLLIILGNTLVCSPPF